MSTPASAKPEDDVPAWRRRKEDRPAEIMAAARELLEARGLSGVSMAKIAERAKVSEALVYRYFDSKQTLVNKVLNEWAQPFILRLLDELSRVDGARSRLVLIAIRYLRGMSETPRLHRVFYQELRWKDYEGSALHHLNRRFTYTVIETIERGISDGELRAGLDPAMVRDMLFGGLEHVAMRSSLAGKTLNVDEQARQFVDVLIDGLVQRRVDDSIERLEAIVQQLEARGAGSG